MKKVLLVLSILFLSLTSISAQSLFIATGAQTPNGVDFVLVTFDTVNAPGEFIICR